MYYLSPSPKLHFDDLNGNPLSAGILKTFLAGSSTPTQTSQDYAGTSLNPTSVTLDERGEAKIRLNPMLKYKFELYDSNHSLIYTVDNIGIDGAVTEGTVASSDGTVQINSTADGVDLSIQDEVTARIAAKTEVVAGSNASVSKAVAADGHSIYTVSTGQIGATTYETWYLDPVNGLDTNSGLSRSAPKKTGDAVVIACKTAGKTMGRLVVMAGTGTVTFTAANWANAAFPFSDVVFETAYTECTWNGINGITGGIFKVVGGEHTFNSCACGGQVSVKADYCIVKGGNWTGIMNFDMESYITVKGMACGGELCIQTPILEIQSKFAINGTAKIQADELYGAGNFVSYNNSAVNLDIQANDFFLEGNFQFSSQAVNSSIKITAAKMERAATTRLLLLGAEAGVTVNYQLVVDTMGSIVPMKIGNPAGTVAGKVIELLKYENKVDAEIIRATAAEALKADLVGGTVPPSQLPSYVDDVVDAYVVGSTPFASDWLSLTVGGTALTPESGKIYIVLTAGIYEMLEFRWSGTVYGEISKSIALGETSSTAYRGDRGKTAYDHSLLTSGNPHGVTKSEVGLGNVDNVSDANKPVSTAQQTALDLKANQTSISNIDNTSDANKPVSTATQTALDLKANKLTTVNNSTATAYTFLASDANTCHIVNTSAATTRTVPSDTTAPDLAIGDSIEVQNIGTGAVTFVAASGVTIRSSLTLVMYGQYSVCMLRKIAANTWILTGERTAV